MSSAASQCVVCVPARALHSLNALAWWRCYYHVFCLVYESFFLRKTLGAASAPPNFLSSDMGTTLLFFSFASTPPVAPLGIPEADRAFNAADDEKRRR